MQLSYSLWADDDENPMVGYTHDSVMHLTLQPIYESLEGQGKNPRLVFHPAENHNALGKMVEAMQKEGVNVELAS